MEAERTVMVMAEVGLHARVAATFVKTASRFSSTIRVRHGDREGNAKSILEVLTLGAAHRAEVTIRADGDDATEALDALESILVEEEASPTA
jgi:phosphotransferase system HPr (HPr) family protein